MKPPYTVCKQTRDLTPYGTVHGSNDGRATLCGNENTELTAELARIKQAAIEQNYSIEQTLGMALHGKDAETGNPLWGDHIAETLAMEAAKQLAALKAELALCIEALNVLSDWMGSPNGKAAEDALVFAVKLLKKRKNSDG